GTGSLRFCFRVQVNARGMRLAILDGSRYLPRIPAYHSYADGAPSGKARRPALPLGGTDLRAPRPDVQDRRKPAFGWTAFSYRPVTADRRSRGRPRPDQRSD